MSLFPKAMSLFPKENGDTLSRLLTEAASLMGLPAGDGE
jgi:hypothetical protein